MLWREVQTEGSKGRCLVAAQALKPGTEILRCEPDAHAIYPSEHATRCHRCLAGGQPKEQMEPEPPPPPPKRCTACGFLRYCSRRCQQADWAEHRYECRALRRLRDKKPGPTLLLAARLVRKVVEGGGPDGPLGQALERLVHNMEGMPAKRRTELREMAALVHQLCLTCKGKEDGDGDPAAHAFDQRVNRALASAGGLDYVARLIARLSSNGFTITDSTGDAIGIGLFLGAVAANHSCAPNAHASFHGTALRLRALQPIAAGDEVCIGYIPVARPRRARQEELLAGYGFHCHCPRCASVAEAARERAVGAVGQEDGWRCPQAGCGGLLVDEGYEAALYRAWRATPDGQDLERVRHQPRPRACRACGWVLGEKAVVEWLGDLSMAAGLLERGRARLGRAGDAAGALPLLEAADAQYRRVLPPLATEVLAVGDALYQCYMGVQAWAKARACLLATGVAAAEARLHPRGSPAAALELATLGKLELQLAGDGDAGEGSQQQQQQLLLLLEASARRLGAALGPLAAAHGEGAPVVEDLRRLRAQVEMLARAAAAARERDR